MRLEVVAEWTEWKGSPVCHEKSAPSLSCRQESECAQVGETIVVARLAWRMESGCSPVLDDDEAVELISVD